MGVEDYVETFKFTFLLLQISKDLLTNYVHIDLLEMLHFTIQLIPIQFSSNVKIVIYFLIFSRKRQASTVVISFNEWMFSCWTVELFQWIFPVFSLFTNFFQ